MCEVARAAPHEMSAQGQIGHSGGPQSVATTFYTIL